MKAPGFSASETAQASIWLLLAAVITGVAELSGGLEKLGITGIFAQILTAAGIAVVLFAIRSVVRWRRVSDLLTHSALPLCELTAYDLGSTRSELARQLQRDGVAPPYVDRDRDEELVRQLTEHRFVVLVGDSGSGKSRSAYEKTVGLYGDMRVLAPRKPVLDSDRREATADPLAELLRARLWPLWNRQGTILWLDDFGRHLDHSTVEAVDLRRWLEGGPNRRIVATLKSKDEERHVTSNSSRARDILNLADEVVRLELTWSTAEKRRASTAYPGASAKPSLSFYFALGPQLLRRYRNAHAHSPPGAAVIRAAIDWRRVGMTQPIPEDMLLELFPIYLTELPPGRTLADLLEEGIAWACDPAAAPEGLLKRVGENPSHYAAHEIAVDHIESQPPPPDVWRVLLHQLVGGAERTALARGSISWNQESVAWDALIPVLDSARDAGVQSAARAAFQQLPSRAAHSDSERLFEPGESAGAGSPGGVFIDMAPPPRTSRAPAPVLAAIDRSTVVKSMVRVGTLLLVDVSSLWLALYCGFVALDVLGDAPPSTYLAAVNERIPFVALLVVLLFSRAGLYRPQLTRANFARLLAALTQAAVALAIVRVLTDARLAPIELIPVTLACSFGFVVLGRLAHIRVARFLRRRALGHVPRQALIGTREQAARVSGALARPHMNRDLIGWIDVDEGARADVVGLRGLGSIASLGSILETYGIDDLVLCSDELDEARATEIVNVASNAGTQVRAIGQRRSFLVTATRYAPGDPLPLEQLHLPRFDPTQWAMKRMFDLGMSSFLLLLLSPVMAVTAALIRFTSRGEVLQQISQPGRDGEPFGLLKFRTTHDSVPEVEEPPVTWIGRPLRRLGLDELPQLFNVLAGQMSLVGPRPISVDDYDRLEEWHRRRNLVVPGITGLWQIAGREDTGVDDMVRLDLYYVQRWSIFIDLEIIAKTVYVTALGRRSVLRLPESSPQPAA